MPERETEHYLVIVPAIVGVILLYAFVDARTLDHMMRAPSALVDFIRPPIDEFIRVIGSLFS